MRVKVTLRTSKTTKQVALTATARKTLKARKTGNYTVQVKLPASLREGAYFVRACADVSGRSTACRFTTRKLTVKKAATQPAPSPTPAPVPVPQPAPSGGGSQDDLPLPDPDDAPDYDVLAFTKGATGSTTSAVNTLKALGEANGFGVTVSEDSASFTAANLDNYKAVVFINNKGDILNLEQQGAFQQYYEAGGGFVAIGSAIEAEPDWSFYGDLIGTRAAAANPLAPQAAGHDQGRRPRP